MSHKHGNLAADWLGAERVEATGPIAINELTCRPVLSRCLSHKTRRKLDSPRRKNGPG